MNLGTFLRLELLIFITSLFILFFIYLIHIYLIWFDPETFRYEYSLYTANALNLSWYLWCFYFVCLEYLIYWFSFHYWSFWAIFVYIVSMPFVSLGLFYYYITVAGINCNTSYSFLNNKNLPSQRMDFVWIREFNQNYIQIAHPIFFEIYVIVLFIFNPFICLFTLNSLYNNGLLPSNLDVFYFININLVNFFLMIRFEILLIYFFNLLLL